MNSEWINVKDKMPDLGQLVIITDGKYVKCGELDRQFGRSDTFYTAEPWGISTFAFCDVTHWMPLPGVPK